MTRQTREYGDVTVGDDTFYVWINPPISLFARLASGNGGLEGQLDAIAEIVQSHTITGEDDQPIATRELATPTLLAFIRAYVERLRQLPKA